METRGMKRKRYDDIKRDLSVELHKLTNASGDFNNDFHGVNKEFEEMCKNFVEKQSDLLSRSIVIEEQYRETMYILSEEQNDKPVETSLQNVQLAPTYSADVRKFVEDAKVSLKGHGEFFKEELIEMGKVMEKYQHVWNQNLNQMRKRAVLIEKEKAKLCTKLTKFNNVVVDDAEEDQNSESSDE